LDCSVFTILITVLREWGKKEEKKGHFKDSIFTQGEEGRIVLC